MTYSLDLRQKVIDYIESGGKITKATKVFGIGRASIYRWLERKELEATKVKHRHRKLDWKELEKYIKLASRRKIKTHSREIWSQYNGNMGSFETNENN